MNNRDSVKISNLESLKRRYNLDVLDCISFETTDTEKSVILKASLQVLGTISQQSNDLSTILFPSGMSFEWNSNSIPSGYLEENGAAVSRTTYAGLFAAIETTFGSGDGSTTFNLPNSKGKVVVGLDSADTAFDSFTDTGGSKYLQSHTHNLDSINHPWASLASSSIRISADDGTTRSGMQSTLSSGTGDSGNLQPYVVKRRIIKY